MSTQPFTFAEAVRFLEAAINYEKIVAWKYDAPSFNLLRVEELLARVGSPHRRLNCVHVAGTKGKGTTSALLAAILTAAGRKTGLFTSPHLLSVTERVIIDGRPISETAFAERIAELRDVVTWQRLTSLFSSPTYFEMLTAVGFRQFEVDAVDVAVIEVGLGGRLDSTNVIQPRLAVLTSIGWDHTDKLGNSLESISSEKAGIVKPGCTVVVGPQRYRKALTVLLTRAETLGRHTLCYGRDFSVLDARPTVEQDRPGWRFSLVVDHPLTGRVLLEDLHLGLLGRHQLGNAATAVAAALALAALEGRAFPLDAIPAGLHSVRWPGRVDYLGGSPLVLVDTAHTVESVQALIAALRTHLTGRRRWYVFACSKDKNPRALLQYLACDADGLIVTRYNMERAADPGLLGALAAPFARGPVVVTEDSSSACQTVSALAARDDVVCFVGSFFLASEIYSLLARPPFGPRP